MSDDERVISMTLSRRILEIVGRVESNCLVRLLCQSAEVLAQSKTKAVSFTAARPADLLELAGDATDASFGHRQLRSVFHSDAGWQRLFVQSGDVTDASLAPRM